MEIVKMLLAAGANAKAKANDGLTALRIAKGEKHAEVVRLLEEAGAE